MVEVVDIVDVAEAVEARLTVTVAAGLPTMQTLHTVLRTSIAPHPVVITMLPEIAPGKQQTIPMKQRWTIALVAQTCFVHQFRCDGGRCN